MAFNRRSLGRGAYCRLGLSQYAQFVKGKLQAADFFARDRFANAGGFTHQQFFNLLWGAFKQLRELRDRAVAVAPHRQLPGQKKIESVFSHNFPGTMIR